MEFLSLSIIHHRGKTCWLTANHHLTKDIVNVHDHRVHKQSERWWTLRMHCWRGTSESSFKKAMTTRQMKRSNNNEKEPPG